jgi:hypothetical protein
MTVHATRNRSRLPSASPLNAAETIARMRAAIGAIRRDHPNGLFEVVTSQPGRRVPGADALAAMVLPLFERQETFPMVLNVGKYPNGATGTMADPLIAWTRKGGFTVEPIRAA